MHVVIVAGPPYAGKSTFIKQHFPDYTRIDLIDFQHEQFMTLDMVITSYEKCRDALVEAIKNNENVVLEHTLLKQIRRPMYIDAVKSVTDAPLDMYFIIPSYKEHMRRAKTRSKKVTPLNIIEYRKIVDLPCKEEGYDNVYIIEEDET